MILAALDTPFVMPQTMAFLFEPSALRDLATALKALVDQDDWKPVHQLGLKNRKELDSQVRHLQFAVNSKWLMDLAQSAQKSALDLNLDLDFSTLIKEFQTQPKILVPPRSYFSLAGMQDAGALVQAALDQDDQGLKFVATARIEGLFETLSNYKTQEDLGYTDPGPHESVDGKVTIPDWTYEDNPTAEEIRDIKRERALSQLRSYHLLEALIGVFVPSRGPGPFLPPPPMARLFNPGEAFADFFQFRYLLPEDLPAAKQWLVQASPTPDWHQAYGLNLDPKDWEDLLRQGEWNRCRDRFALLLAEAERDHKGILFLENELSHPFWPGADWPERITS